MPKKKYIVDLTKSERAELEQLTKKGKIAAYKMNHARILGTSQSREKLKYYEKNLLIFQLYIHLNI